MTGESGTTGYADVYIAKSLVQDASSIKVILDENSLDYTATSTEDSWLLHFTYNHSTHNVVVNLGTSSVISEIADNWLIYLAIIVIVLIVAIAIIAVKKRNK